MECQRCGQCCTNAPIKLWILTEENKSEMLDRATWLSYHRCDIQINKERGIEVSIPLSCIHLAYDDNNLATCKIHDSKPRMCQDFKCQRIGGTSAKG